MKTKKLANFTILSFLLSVVLVGCSILQGTEAPQAEPILVVDDSTVSVTGVVVPEKYTALSVPVSGLAAEVLVAEGQAVESGQELLVLNERLPAEAALKAAEYEREAAQQALDALNEDADLERNAAWLALLDAKTVYLAAEEAWDEVDQDDYQDDIDAAREDVVEAKEDLQEAQDDFDSYKDVDEDNAQRVRYEDALKDAQKAYNESIRTRDTLIMDLEKLEADLAAAADALDQAVADYEATRSGADPDRLALAESRLNNAVAQVEAAQFQLDNLTVLAPYAGTITVLDIKPGEWAVPGRSLITLADLTMLRVETTDLNEIDVAKINRSDPAAVTFDAFPDLKVMGVVARIAAKPSPGSGVNYTVIIELEEVPGVLRWGMTAFVDIETEE